ncbi:hypothetical protein [uncultured Bifidobacterium sp.]|uniref:hypothetical protein n=1 Tax=uncultured Bifidobacterium sp. TaxID=165187 RepID=UPI002597788E|nr:hypothetical protein [uncultured Bifidobacterium sp.]
MADTTTLGELITFMRSSCRTVRLRDDEFRFNPKTGELEYDLGDGIVTVRMTAEAIKGVCSIFKAPGAWIAKQRPDIIGYLLDDMIVHYRGEDLEIAFELVTDDNDPSVIVASNAYDTSKRWGITDTLEEVSESVPKDWVVIQPDVANDHVSLYVYDPKREEEQPDAEHSFAIGTHISYKLEKGKAITVNTALINTVDETAVDLSFDGTGRVGADNTKAGISEVIRVRMGESDDQMAKLYETRDNVIDDVEHMIDSYSKQCGLGVRLVERVKTDVVGASGLTALELADLISRSEMGVKSESDAAKIALLAGCAFMAHDPHRCPRCHQEVDDETAVDTGALNEVG